MTDDVRYCPGCGEFLEGDDRPRRCARCGRTHYSNPTPVAVLVQPIDAGVLTVRRAIDPGRGELALPGGFIDLGESWQEAAARELAEETGVTISPEVIEVLDVLSAPDGTLLVFGVAPPLTPAQLDGFEASHEVSELVVVRQPQALAFSLHTAVIGRWFHAWEQRRPGGSR